MKPDKNTAEEAIELLRCAADLWENYTGIPSCAPSIDGTAELIGTTDEAFHLALRAYVRPEVKPRDYLGAAILLEEELEPDVLRSWDFDSTKDAV